MSDDKIDLPGGNETVLLVDDNEAVWDVLIESLQELGYSVILAENGLDIKGMPLVIQFNKRDLPNIRSDEEIDSLADKGREPVFKAVATRGEGVMETFFGLLELTWNRLNAWHDLEGKFGINGDELLDNLKKQLSPPETN